MKKEFTLSDILREREKGTKRALKLQAKEYRRRLKVLNGEGERIKEILKESIPREVFDRTVGSITEKYDRIIRDLGDKVQLNTNYNNAQEGKNQLTKWVPWVIAAAALIYSIYKK
jgi:hypothetical protein